MSPGLQNQSGLPNSHGKCNAHSHISTSGGTPTDLFDNHLSTTHVNYIPLALTPREDVKNAKNVPVTLKRTFAFQNLFKSFFFNRRRDRDPV